MKTDNPAAAPARPLLIIICGLSFAGKTTLARAICRRFACAEVDVDLTKTRLHPGAEDASLSRGQWQAVYDEADREIAAHLRRGGRVVDASRNFTRAERTRAAELAVRCGARLVTIYVDTPAPLARQRWLANCASPERRQVSPEDFEAIMRGFEPPGADEAPLVFHHNDDLSAWLGRCAAAFEAA